MFAGSNQDCLSDDRREGAKASGLSTIGTPSLNPIS